MNFLSLISTAFLVAVSIYPIAFSQPSYAGSIGVIYKCVVKDGAPTTVAITPSLTVNLIAWTDTSFSGFTPAQRCEIVTASFQRHSDAGSLRYISTGILNKQKVICVARSSSGECLRNGLLLTLKPSDNPKAVLREIFDAATGVAPGAVHRGASDELVIDMEKIFVSNAQKK
ncbi:MAG: COP23 domain-containing protein [bacterium]|nr:COP23 domain-containing protein [bacterium]